LLRDSAKILGTATHEVVDKASKLAEQLRQGEQDRKNYRDALAKEVSKGLLAKRQGDLLCADLSSLQQSPRADSAFLLELAKRLTDTPTQVALLAASDDQGTHVLALRGKSSEFDCGGFVRTLAQSVGGRGGGRPDHGQGLLSPIQEPWEDLVKKHLS